MIECEILRRGLLAAGARASHRLPWLLVALLLHALLLAALLLPGRAAPPAVLALPLEAEIIIEPQVTPRRPPLKPVKLVRPTARIVVPAPNISVADPIATAATAPEQPADGVKDTSIAPPVPSEPISPPRLDAAYLHNPAPEYPLESRRLREQGSVLLRVEVSTQGSALTIVIEQSSGWRLLDNSAVDAVKHWRFVPARRGADPIEAWVLVPIDFELSG